jgi:hypothetical protein
MCVEDLKFYVVQSVLRKKLLLRFKRVGKHYFGKEICSLHIEAIHVLQILLAIRKEVTTIFGSIIQPLFN